MTSLRASSTAETHGTRHSDRSIFHMEWAARQLFIFLTITGRDDVGMYHDHDDALFHNSALRFDASIIHQHSGVGVGLVFGGLGTKLSHEAYGRQKKKK